MRVCYWLGFAVCLASASTRAGQIAVDVVPDTPASAAPAKVVQAKQRLAQHRVAVARLQRAVERQESHSQQASEQLRQQDAEILKLQNQLRSMSKTTPAAGG